MSSSSKAKPCTFYVAAEGGDNENSGTAPDEPLATLDCATDPNCNAAVQVRTTIESQTLTQTIFSSEYFEIDR